MERLIAWVFLDSVFRYPGLPAVITDTLFEQSFLADTQMLFKDGFSIGNADLLIDCVYERILFFAEMRTDVAPIFARGDGRQQLVRGRPVDQHASHYRPLDHLLEGMRTWREPVLKAGQAFWSVLVTLWPIDADTDAEISYGLASAGIQKPMQGLLGVELLGRTTISQESMV